VATVHEDGELDFRGAAKRGDRIEGGAGRAAGEKHIVHQDQRAVVEIDGEIGDFKGGDFAARGEVVAVHRDIDCAKVGFDPVNFLDVFGEAAGDFQTTGGNSGENKPVGGGMLLNDLMGHAADGFLDRVGVEGDCGVVVRLGGLVCHASLAASRDRFKGRGCFILWWLIDLGALWRVQNAKRTYIL
jgi:hypothetical protein